MSVKLIVILLMKYICASTADEMMKTYKSEVSDTLNLHIIAKTLALFDGGLNGTQVANSLREDLNVMYGKGWQIITAINADLSTLDMAHESNSLLYFSYNMNHFYIFKQLMNPTSDSGNNSANSSCLKDLSNLVNRAKEVKEIKFIRDHFGNETITKAISLYSLQGVQNVNESCDYTLKGLLGMSACIDDIRFPIHVNLRHNFPEYEWVVNVGDGYYHSTVGEVYSVYAAYKIGDLLFTVWGFLRK